MAGLFGGLFELFKEDPELKREQFKLDKNLVDFYRGQAKKLQSESDADEGYLSSALADYEGTKSKVFGSLDADAELLEGMRPGGAQETRVGNLISAYMDAARKASATGLARSAAKQKAALAIGGNSAFADSGYRRRQSDNLYGSYERDLAEKEGQLRIDNALRFLGAYRPGAIASLQGQRLQYGTVPLALRAQKAALDQARAGGVGQGLRNAIDTHYYWKRDKNWADYAQAVDEIITNLAMSYFGGGFGGMMGGMGGGGGGGGGGFGGGGGGMGASAFGGILGGAGGGGSTLSTKGTGTWNPFGMYQGSGPGPG